MRWFLLLISVAGFAQEWPSIGLHRLITGLQNITDVAAPPDGLGRLFVLEQAGRVRVIENGVLRAAPLLDWSDRVRSGGERGLLGIAFPPGFAQKQHFYLSYTASDGSTVVSRVRMADFSEQIILRIGQPFPNHNGGGLAFGPDGYLYVGTGDGGSSNDPDNNGQRTDTLLGKMLRIDPESGSTLYDVPASNPFVGRMDYRAEIWARGLRNPWRYSFDRETGDLWIADVGQNRAEEVNFQPASSRGGENYGWRIMEGLQCRDTMQGCNREGLTLPVLEYGRNMGQSVTGGFVYRGSRFPALQGIYFFSDFGSGRIWGVRRAGDAWQSRVLLNAGDPISTFAQDEAGELYVATYGGSLMLLTSGAPRVNANGVVNAASFGSGLVAGSLATVFGRGLTSFNGVVQAGAFPLPLELTRASITLNGIRAPIIATANVNGQEQINFQVPLELAGASRATLVVNANGQSSSWIEVQLVREQPEIFAVTRSEGGITIWATGLGPVSNSPATGQPAPDSPLAMTVAEAQVTVDGATVPVTYSGLAPGFAGLYQVNATTSASGDVVLRIGTGVSRPWRLSAP